MKIVHLFAATAIALVAVPVFAADTGSFSRQRLSQHIQTLGSDAYEGRGVNTRAEVKTIDYIVGQFKVAGLQPGGEVVNGQRQWTQRVPLLQSEIAGDPMVTIQNAGGGMRLTQGNEISVRAPQNGQNQIRIDNAPLVFVGYGVSAP